LTTSASSVCCALRRAFADRRRISALDDRC
jgi:hypothetical protein